MSRLGGARPAALCLPVLVACNGGPTPVRGQEPAGEDAVVATLDASANREGDSDHERHGDGDAAAPRRSTPGPSGEVVPEHALTVARHEAISISKERVEEILAQMSHVLKKDDNGHADVECDVKFTLKGDVVETFATSGEAGIPPDGVVRTPAEYLAVDGLPYDVKIVDGVQWCGCGNIASPNLIGCAEQRSSMVVTRTAISEEPNLWAHEFGHMAGLEHRDVGSNDTRALMAPMIVSNRRNVTLVECGAFRSGPSGSVSVTCGLTDPAAVGAVSEEDFERQLRLLVQSTFVHGVPVARARLFGEGAIGFLGAWLNDPNDYESWPNIVLTMGAIGGDQALEFLVEFATRSEIPPRVPEGVARERYERVVLRSRENAIAAVGFAVNGGATDGFARLAQWVRPATWTKETIAVSEDVVEEADARFGLAAAALLALGLSGHPDVEGVLDPLKDPATLETLRGEQRERFGRIVEHVRRVLGDVRESGGLESYFSKPN